MTFYSCADGSALSAQALDVPLAPSPTIDRYPIIIGQGLTLAYLAAVSRSSLQGYRQPFVDLLCELLDHDPHAVCVILQRVLSVAGGRLEIVPAKVPEGDPDEAVAKQIAEEFACQFDAIPSRTQILAHLLWGDFFGVSACETDWDRSKEGWRIKGMRPIHNRRLAYPDHSKWDLYIWDQGVWGFQSFGEKMRGTGGYPGLRLADYPGKFLAHAPALRAEYPTRDGLGRVIATYLAIKRMVVRGVAADLERNSRPQAIGTYTTTNSGAPRVASKEDIIHCDAAIQAIGAGNLSAITIPDTIKIDLMRAAGTMTPFEFLGYLDAAISKAVVAQTYTVEPGKYGAKGTAEQGKKQLLDVTRYSAGALGDSINRDLVTPWMSLNYKGPLRDLAPRVKIHVEEVLPIEKVAKVVEQMGKLNWPIDQDAEAQRMGIKLIPKELRKTAEPVASPAAEPAKEPEPKGATKTPADDAQDTLDEQQSQETPEL